MNSMDKILRIANGAKPMNTTMSSADRIMQYAAPQAEPQPQDNSTWGRFKNFAGSNAGRTLLGGLGAGLGVALTGGNLQDALGYGVIGAGNTVDTLNQNRQYANRLALKQQERADALAKEQRDNQFKLGLQDRALAQSKQLADYQLDKTLARLRGEQEIKDTAEKAARQRKIDAINSNPYLTEDQKQWQIAGLDGLNFDRGAYYTDTLLRDPNNSEALDYFNNRAAINNLIAPVNYTETVLKNAEKFTPESFGDFSKSGDISQLVPNKKYASGDLGLVQMMVEEGTPLAEALDRVDKMTPDQKIAFEGRKAGAIKGAEQPYVLEAQNNQAENTLEHDETMAGMNYGYNQLAADNALWRSKQLETFKNSLPLPEQRLITAQSQATGIPESVIYRVGLEKQIADARQIWANVAKTVADTRKINRELSQPYLSPVEEARQKERAKQEEKLKFKQQEQDMADVRDFYSSVSEFPVLQKQMDDLKNTAEMATGSGFGRMVDATGAFFGGTTDGAENAAKFESQALNVVLPQLKKIFGGNISDGEREALVKLIGEKDSTAREKQARINAFVANKAALMAQKAADLADRKLIPADVAKAQISFYEGLINPKANEASADTVVDYKNKYNLE